MGGDVYNRIKANEEKRYKRINGTTLPKRFNFQTFTMASYEQCKQRCNEHHACNAFNFNSDPEDLKFSNLYNCALKSNATYWDQTMLTDTGMGSRSWDLYVEESVYDTITPDAVTYDTADRTCRLDYNVSTEDWKDFFNLFMNPNLITTKLDREAWEEGDAIGCINCSVDVEGTMSEEECFHAGKTAL